MKFIICSPLDLNVGGPLVLHKLCEMLNNHGHDAKIFAMIPNVKMINFSWNDWYLKLSKMRYLKFKKRIKVSIRGGLKFNFLTQNNKIYSPLYTKRYVSDDTIVVYPEIIDGNPLGAKKVVRWLLHRPGFHSGRIDYTENELFFAYNAVFNDVKYNPLERLCTISYFNNNVWKQINFGERKDACYIVRKGAKRDDLPSNLDGEIIDNRSDEEIAEIFNKYKYCISYDTMTFYLTLAAKCGCIPVIIPMPNISIDEWDPSKCLRKGIAYGFDDEQTKRAASERDYRERLISEIDIKNEDNISYFIKTCSSYFF